MGNDKYVKETDEPERLRQTLSEIEMIAGCGRWEYDLVQYRLDMSDNLLRIYDINPETSSSPPELDDLLARIHPEDLNHVRTTMRQAIAAQTEFDIEHRIVLPGTGEIRHVHSAGRIRRDESGTAVSLLGLARDVTRRRQAQEQLQEREERLKLILEEHPFSIIFFDAQGRIEFVNSFHLAHFAHFSRGAKTKADYLGRSLVELDCLKQAGLSEILARVLQGETVEVMDVPLPDDAGGALGYATIRAVPITRHGQVVGGALISDDVTERKQLMDEQRQAKVAAEEASRAKTMFLASMSHEIRTPMTGVLGALDMALSMGVEDRLGRVLEMARASTKSLLTLIGDILDISKIEAGKIELCLERFDMFGLIERVLGPFDLEARRKGLILAFEHGPDLPDALVGDPLRLGQVLTNLVGNAMKFTPSGSVRIGIRRKQLDSPRVLLEFTVQDTGVGIPKDRIRAIFDQFTQADPAQASNGGGVGLGLAIAHRLVELMGGEISVQSEVGQGSTFTFTALFEEAPHAELDRPQASSCRDARQGSPLTLLLADDDPVIREFVAYFLERAGHVVKAVENGRQALEAVETGRFDLVLMDVQMPVMDGLSVTRAIRRNASGSLDSDVPILGLTAYVATGDRERFLEAGMNGYMAKPLDVDELLATVTRLARPASRTSAPGREPGLGHGLNEAFRRERFAGREVFLRRIENIFKTVGPEHYRGIRDSLDQEDFSAAARAAHSLSGGAATIGALALADRARAIERACDSGRIEEARDLLGGLEEDLDRLVEHLGGQGEEGRTGG